MLVGPYALVVSNGVLQNSSEIFTVLDPDSGGADTFKVPLSADGLDPTTHWGAYGYFEPETITALGLSTTEFKAYVDDLATERERPGVGSVTAFKNNVQISAEGQDFYEFVATLGLQRIKPPSDGL